MRRKFVPAARSIPGGGAADGRCPNCDEMDVDGGGGGDDDPHGGGLITHALRNQPRAVTRQTSGADPRATTADDLRTTANQTEERNMHSLYRLLSRCVQLLDLVSCLRRAHSTPALPEVRWGALHGLTFQWLATTWEGRCRVESLLNALVSGGGGGTRRPAARQPTGTRTRWRGSATCTSRRRRGLRTLGTERWATRS